MRFKLKYDFSKKKGGFEIAADFDRLALIFVSFLLCTFIWSWFGPNMKRAVLEILRFLLAVAV